MQFPEFAAFQMKERIRHPALMFRRYQQAPIAFKQRYKFRSDINKCTTYQPRLHSLQNGKKKNRFVGSVDA